MILIGPALKTIMKRDVKLTGEVERKYNYAEVTGYSIIVANKPGVWLFRPELEIDNHRYTLCVQPHNDLINNAEVSYQSFLNPGDQLPDFVVRPLNKEFDFNSLPYICRIMVLEGRHKKIGD